MEQSKSKSKHMPDLCLLVIDIDVGCGLGDGANLQLPQTGLASLHPSRPFHQSMQRLISIVQEVVPN